MPSLITQNSAALAARGIVGPQVATPDSMPVAESPYGEDSTASSLGGDQAEMSFDSVGNDARPKRPAASASKKPMSEAMRRLVMERLRAHEESKLRQKRPPPPFKDTIELVPPGKRPRLDLGLLVEEAACPHHGKKLPTLPLPKPPTRRKKADKSRRICTGCSRSSATETNILVVCRFCDELWHQDCNEPRIEDPRRPFKCAACFIEDDEQLRYRELKKEHADLQRQLAIDTARAKCFAAFPLGVVMDNPSLVGFPAGTSTDEKRTEYFERMGRSDQLSVIGLCDKLVPGLLADVLVSITKKHPHLPIFKCPDWAARLDVPIAPKKVDTYHSSAKYLKNTIVAGKKPSMKVYTPHEQPLAWVGMTLPRSKGCSAALVAAREKAETSMAAKVVASQRPGPPANLNDDDLLPASWPKQGNGLYSVLTPEKTDRANLVEPDDESSDDGDDEIPNILPAHRTAPAPKRTYTQATRPVLYPGHELVPEPKELEIERMAAAAAAKIAKKNAPRSRTAKPKPKPSRTATPKTPPTRRSPRSRRNDKSNPNASTAAPEEQGTSSMDIDTPSETTPAVDTPANDNHADSTSAREDSSNNITLDMTPSDSAQPVSVTATANQSSSDNSSLDPSPVDKPLPDDAHVDSTNLENTSNTIM